MAPDAVSTGSQYYTLLDFFSHPVCINVVEPYCKVSAKTVLLVCNVCVCDRVSPLLQQRFSVIWLHHIVSD